MTLTQITEKGIKDGEIVNADINASAAIAKSKLASLDIVNGDISASAAIAGSKVSPDFGSQNIVTTGDITVGGTNPIIHLTDSNDNSDYQLNVNAGVFQVYDYSNTAGRLLIASDGTVDIAGNLDANGGVDVTGNLTADRVLIGTSTTNQYDNLLVSDPGDVFMSIRSDAAADNTRQFLDFGTGFADRSSANQTASIYANIHSQSGGTLKSDLTFQTNSGNSISDKVIIKDTGYVGIGTTSPNQKLHVSGGGINLDSGWNTQWGSNSDRAYIQGNSGSSGTVLIGTNNNTKLTIQGTGQINHNGPLIFTKNNQPNPYNSSLQANDGAIGIRGDMGSGNYWGWRQRSVADTSVTNANAIKVLPSISDFQYPNDSDGMLIASTNKIGFAASAESPQYANGVQMIFDSDGLALGSGNAFDHTHGSITSANANVVIRTNGNIVLKSGAGIDFSATADLTGKTSELFDDYEEGTWTPSLNKAGATGNADSAVGTRAGFYVKSGSMLWISFYWYSANLSFGTGGSAWYIDGLPHNLLTQINSAYQFIPGGYLYQNGHTGVSHQAGYRWQSNSTNGADTITMYGQGNTTNASGGAWEFSGCGVLRTT